MDGLEEFLLRDMGRFVLRGKSRPVHVFEMVGLAASADEELTSYCARFSSAMRLVQEGRIDAASALLREIEVARPGDRAVRFYLAVLAGDFPFEDGVVVLH